MTILKKKKFEGRRWPDQDWSNFRANHGNAEPFEIVGAAHPFDARRADLLPEGATVGSSRLFLTYDMTVRGIDEEDQASADEIKIDGSWYRVHAAMPTPPPGRHHELVLVRRQTK